MVDSLKAPSARTQQRSDISPARQTIWDQEKKEKETEVLTYKVNEQIKEAL